MSLKKDIDVQGKASVSRDANVGGNANVRGNVTVGHDLVVKGWVDAPNIKGACKGLYGSEEALKAAYPRPMRGWFALVGNTLPAQVWRAEAKARTPGQILAFGTLCEWVATGEEGGEFTLWLDRLETDVDDIRSEAEVTRENLDKEVSDRTAADSALGKRIDNEATSRSLADTALGTRIDNEATTRSTADSALDKRLVPVEGKTAAMVLCDGGILAPTDTPTKPGTYLQRDTDGDLMQVVTVTAGATLRSVPEEGRIYVCAGVAYLFNGIILEPAGHTGFVFEGGDAFSQYPYPTPVIGGGTPSTDYTVAKVYDGGKAVF